MGEVPLIKARNLCVYGEVILTVDTRTDYYLVPSGEEGEDTERKRKSYFRWRNCIGFSGDNWRDGRHKGEEESVSLGRCDLIRVHETMEVRKRVRGVRSDSFKYGCVKQTRLNCTLGKTLQNELEPRVRGVVSCIGL